MSAFRNELIDNCWRRDWDGLSDCLTRGYPVNQMDCHGLTSLQVCAALGWTAALSVLLENGADLHVKSPLGWTALMQAVRNGHTDSAEVLLDAGANVADSNSLGLDVISLAVASKNDVLLKTLVQKTKASHLNSALLIACQSGSVSAVKFLIEQKADINYKVPISELTPLMLAASEGHEGIVRILLQHRANAYCMNSCNLTALDMALMNGEDSIVALLSLHLKPTVPLKQDLSFSHHYLSIPQLPDKTVSPSPHDRMEPLMNFYLPMHPSPVVGPTSPQIFLYPPPPNPFHTSNLSSNGFHVVSPSISFPYSPVYFVPPTCHCYSPCVPSPIIPAWMFSPWQKTHNKEAKPTVKTTKSIKKWWRRLKRRCNVKRQKKRVKVHMTYGEDSNPTSARKLEEVLSVLKLEYLASLLRSHEVDIETFKHLRENDLEELGIADKTLQLSILQKIAIFNANCSGGA